MAQFRGCDEQLARPIRWAVTRRAILVLGMHRSGTSAVTGLLVRLGARAKTLIRPNEHNPLGFWESDAFFAYHERLLRDAGTDWDEWTPVAVDGLIRPRSRN